MIKLKKISNLKRLNFYNKLIVCAYFVKIIFKIKPSSKELEVYVFYNFLINFNGTLFQETDNFFIADFKNNFQKRIKIRKRPSSDIDVFQQIYFWAEYLPVVATYKDNFIHNNAYRMNIIDAGANIGLTSLFFLEHFVNSKIISIEPEIENFKVLDYNLNSVNYKYITKINAAIWSGNSKIKIVKDFRDKLDWSFRVEETKDENSINAYSINQIVSDFKLKYIDILKIDIEGSEKEIFTSLKSNLDFLKITKCIAIEIHDEYNCREEIYNVLKSYNFEYFNQGELTIGYNQRLTSIVN